MTEERRYEVLAELGRGGFGTVYHARFLGEGGFCKEVALKMLNPDMENIAEIASRLRDEARVLGLIRHRAIVSVDRLTQIDGRWTIVMEYIEGHDLGHFINMGPMPVGVALEIAAEVAGALNAAYSRVGPNGQPLCLLHRDIKPSNIRITPFGEVKILDFGIARADFVEREAKTRSLAFGTPDYMSPERLDFSSSTAAGDIYALGVVLHELLTGVQLGRSSANQAKHKRKMEAAVAAQRDARVPEPVVTLLWKMLSFDEQHRPGASEVELCAVSLARSLCGVTLREWINGVGVRPSTDSSDGVSGVILVERTDQSPRVLETIWQRAPMPPSDAPRAPPQAFRPQPGATDNLPVGPASTKATAERTSKLPQELTSPPWRFARWLTLGSLTILLLASAAKLWLWEQPQEMGALSPLAESAWQEPTTSALEPQPITTALSETPAIIAPIPPDAPPATTVAAASTPSKEAEKPRAASATVTVALAGDAKQASLISKSMRKYRLPGRVPTGSYEILASFDGEQETSAGRVRLEPNQPITIQCDASFEKCVVRGTP